MNYTIYTDGGCAFNPGGPGGAAAVIKDERGKKTEISRGYAATTNNRMEITAVILALEEIRNQEHSERPSVRLYSDSQYVLNCMAGVWGKKKNTDLWEKLDRLAKDFRIKTKWVRGHNGNQDNERCDELCTLAMENPEYTDDGYLAEKETGRQFWKQMDGYLAKPQSGGAMAKDIKLPVGFRDQTISFSSVRQYTKEHQVHSSCASAILDFSMKERHSFKDYLKIKTGGIDFWSRKSPDTILKENAQKDLIQEILSQNLPEEKDRKTALRWYARGLPLKDAIRKVHVDNEVSANCR